MQRSPKKGSFHLAAFAIDGSLMGVDTWSSDRLSEKWLGICSEYLQQHGSSFDEPWSGNLSHIRTKVTSVAGAALVTFSANGRVAASVALVSGESQAAESSVLEMFVRSLRQTNVVRAAASSQDAFQQVQQITQRPLMVVVPWPDDLISDQDHALVRELSIHLAGAFFLSTR